MTTADGYQSSADDLAALASAFKVNSDSLGLASIALEAAEGAQLAWLWGSAGTLARVGYEVESQASILALNLVATTLGAVGDAVAALAIQYGANESDTAGIFDQIM
jgi:hypothetical protein